MTNRTWEKKFAWLPKRLVLTAQMPAGDIVFDTIIGHQWIWLVEYWQREKVSFIWDTAENGPRRSYEYAVDFFDVIRKA